jgi:hypothetical protein
LACHFHNLPNSDLGFLSYLALKLQAAQPDSAMHISPFHMFLHNFDFTVIVMLGEAKNLAYSRT